MTSILDEGSVEEVISSNSAILAAKWSPNEEHFLVVLADGTLIQYNTLFDFVSSVDLDDGDETYEPDQEITSENSQIKEADITWKADSRIFAINYLINGGYKCLTRDIKMDIIKGPARADKDTQEINVQSVSEKPIKSMKLPITMMPSGSLIAGFQIIEESDNDVKHKIIFWEKNGLRHGQIELPTFNGHLPFVKSMKFNSDTSFLAVLIDFEGDRSKNSTIPKNQILIMHRSNYHWYIKRTIESFETNIHEFCWLSSKKNQLMLIDLESNFSFYDFQFVYHTSSDVSTKDYDSLSYTANVDFRKVLVTPLSKQVIPPPMSEKVIDLNDQPNSLYFFKNYLFVLLAHEVAFIDCVSGEVQYIEISKDLDSKDMFQKVLFVEKDDTDNKCEGVLILLSSLYGGKAKCRLHEFLVKMNSESKLEILDTYSVPCNRVYSWCVGPYQYFDPSEFENVAKTGLTLDSLKGQQLPDEDNVNARMAMFLEHQSDEEEKVDNSYHKCIYMQYLSKKIQTYTPQLLYNDEGKFKDYEYQIAHLCYRIDVVFCQGQLCLFTLSNTNKLSLNGNIFSKDCTSMLVTRDFLFFINGTLYLMYVYNLNKELPKPVLDINDPDPSKAMPKLPLLEDNSFHVRNIERGSRLVCCNKTKTILQMPRGNLEGIRHRIPLLYHAENLIENAQYGVAFRMLRKHKIDMNLLCDVNYQKFKQNVSLFVDQNLKIDFLNLFIMSLKEEESKELQFLRPQSGEDIIRRQFGNIENDGEKISKINEVCDLLRNEFNSRAEYGCDIDLTLPILTTYAKKTPQELTEVLYLIKSLKEKEAGKDRQVIPPHLNPATMKKEKKDKTVYSEDALQYICWLVDANKLYNVALQTYDFDLVTMVATQTQKDPREFLPYLNSLKQMDPQYMKFKIQFDLKEFDLALLEISKADDKYFDEALSMIKKQRLYRQALRYYSEKPELAKAIKLNFADYLHQRKYYEEAGLIYKYAGEYEKALISLKETPNYQMLFAVANLLNYDENQTHSLAVEYAGILAKDDKFLKEAGIVLAKYHNLNETDTGIKAIEMLVKTQNYFYAIECINSWDKQGQQDVDVYRQKVKNGVKLAYELKFNNIEKRIKDYREKLLRLKIVQFDKKNFGSLNALGIGEGTFDAETMSQSQLSDASLASGTKSLSGLSETSKLSQARVRMGKSKKKSKQKKSKKVPKEGSPFEEEMLVEYLGKFDSFISIIDDIEISKAERDEVSNLMKALVYFEYVSKIYC